jgi:membrane protein
MRIDPRLDNVLSWLTGSIITASAVVLAIRLQEARRADALAARPLPPSPSPAQEPLNLQVARARQGGRGRQAQGPLEIPWRGWKDIALRSCHEIEHDRLLAVAASVAFYSLLALFPALAAGVSSYALFSNAGTISQHLSLLGDIVPSGALDIVRDEVTRIAAKSDGKLTFGFLVGLGIALWSANAGMKAMFDALNIIYDEEEKRGFVRLNLVSLLFTVGAIASALCAVAAIVVFPLLLAALGWSSFDAPWIAFLRWPVLFVLILTGLALLFRYGPSRRMPKWRWISVGSLFAASAWLVVSALFSWYLGNFANYNATYGALGAVVGLMVWMWLSAIVVLVGAELNSEIEHQTACDSTVGAEARSLGLRGAVMADTVGAAKAA